jgi:hypothetical protein
MRSALLIFVVCFSFAGSSRLCVFGADNSYQLDTLKPTKTQPTKFRMKKSPWLAVLQSALVPGLGQLYNESYWKIPIIAGLVGYLGYEVYANNKKFLDYRDRYAASQTPENQYGDLSLQTLRNFYRDQRDEFIWFLAIVYVLNLVDAYVDAHLFDFDIREQKLESQGVRYSTPQLRFKIRL